MVKTAQSAAAKAKAKASLPLPVFDPGAFRVRWRDPRDQWHDEPLRAAQELQPGQLRPVHNVSRYKGQRHFSGQFYLATTGQHVPYRTILSQDWLYDLDYDLRVEAVVGLPFYVRDGDEEDAVSVDPDFLVIDRGERRRLITTNWKGRLTDSRRAKLTIAVLDAACKQLGWRHDVLGQPNRTRRRNLRFLHGAARPVPWLEHYRKDLLTGARDWTPLGEVIAGVGFELMSRPCALHLLWTQQLQVQDMDAQLSDRMLVRAAPRRTRRAVQR